MANQTPSPDGSPKRGVKIYDRPAGRPVWVLPVVIAVIGLIVWFVFAQWYRSQRSPAAEPTGTISRPSP